MPNDVLGVALKGVLALALTPSADATGADTDPRRQAGTSSGTATTATSLDAITVTAQHRTENVQRIALAVSVIDGTTLQQVHATDLSALATLVPSVSFSAGNELRNNSLRIRGVGTDLFSTGVEPSVATVVDGVVLQRPGPAFSDLVDIERVEVLRGPQGTLFGKNASAGVVNIITRAPDFERTGATVNALVAQDSEYRLDSAISGPLGASTAYRLVGYGRTQGGTVTNLRDGRQVNGLDAWGVRGKLAWRSQDQGSDVTLAADYGRLDADCCALPLQHATRHPLALDTGTDVGANNEEVHNDVAPYVRQENHGVAITANIGIGANTLTSITAYRRFENVSNVDLDDTQAQLIRSNFNIESSRTTTQELRWISPTGGTFDYLLGAYYFDGSVRNVLDRRGLNISAVSAILPDGTLVPRVPGDDAVLAGQSVVDNRSASVFGQGRWHVTQKLLLSLGLRYIDEDLTMHFERPQDARFNGSDMPATNPAFGPVTGRYSDGATIGKASASMFFTAHTMGYLSYSTGYKGEGLAATLGLTAEQFRRMPAPAETSTLLETGVKTTLLDHRLLLDVTAFRMRMDDYQAQVYDAANGLFVLTSAGGVAIDGLEIEFTAQPTQALSLVGGVTYLDARFDDVPHGPCFTGQTAAQGCVPSSPGGAAVQNLNGKPFINAPRWRAVGTARYLTALDERVDGFLQGDLRWQDDVVFDMSQNPAMKQAAYAIADLAAGLVFGGGKYELELFVKNLFNREYAANVMAVSAAGGIDAYAQQLPRDHERYAGLSFRVQF